MEKIHVENGKTKLNDDFFNQLQNNIEKAIEDSKKAENPVGHIRIETTDTNPADILGFGTWVLWGQGRVPVGVDTTQTEFNTVEKEIGEKEHKHYNGVYSVDNKLAISNKNSLNSVLGEQIFSVNGTTGFTSRGSTNVYKYASESESSIQPSITCYMWKRIA